VHVGVAPDVPGHELCRIPSCLLWSTDCHHSKYALAKHAPHVIIVIIIVIIVIIIVVIVVTFYGPWGPHRP
jgi:hypothetical protein